MTHLPHNSLFAWQMQFGSLFTAISNTRHSVEHISKIMKRHTYIECTKLARKLKNA